MTAAQHGQGGSVHVVAVVAAAGRGARLGAGTAKALVEVCGMSLLRRCVDGLTSSGVVDLVVVVAPAGLLGVARSALPPEVHVVSGGVERSDSVRAGVAEARRVAPEAAHLLIHDAARALTPGELIRSVVAALRAGALAVVPVLPVTDTIKSVDADGVVTSTPDRDSLRTVQTPQGFAADVLHSAYDGQLMATDDAGLVERSGVAVHTVPGHPLAFKITTATDLALAESLLRAGS